MFSRKRKTVASTPLSDFVRKTSSGEKKRVYIAALKKASAEQNNVIERVAARRIRGSAAV